MSTEPVEDLDSFRQRARTFIRENLRPLEVGAMAGLLRNDKTDEEELAEVARDREVQRMLFDAGLAGICIPPEYGGQGLTPAHQKVLNEEITGYECPVRFQSPTFTPCAAVLLDFGTEEQKRTHIPAMLRGEELWMQFLSEPSGGSVAFNTAEIEPNITAACPSIRRLERHSAVTWCAIVFMERMVQDAVSNWRMAALFETTSASV